MTSSARASTAAQVLAYHLRSPRTTTLAFHKPIAAAPKKTTTDSNWTIINSTSDLEDVRLSPMTTVTDTPQTMNRAITAVDAIRIQRCAFASRPVSA